MKVVGAALGRQRDLSPAGIARVGIGIGGSDPEFLHRVGRHIQNTGKCITIILVVDPNAIERHVGLVAAQTVHRAAARVRVLIQLVAQIRYTSLQTQQLHYVAVGNGQLRDLVFFESVAQRGVRAIDEWRFGLDVDRRGRTRNLQANGYGGGSADHERDLRR